jgi:hypothetical protein
MFTAAASLASLPAQPRTSSSPSVSKVVAERSQPLRLRLSSRPLMLPVGSPGRECMKRVSADKRHLSDLNSRRAA